MRIVKAAMTIGGFTAISRVFGLVREMLISHLLGASIVTDAFFVAFKFPNLFRRIFAEGAFNASFVPLFSQTLVSKGPEAARKLAENIFVTLGSVLLIFVGIVVYFTPSIIHVLAPGFVTTPKRFELAVTYTQITFPYILFISLTAHLSGVLNSLDRFASAAGVPILLNVMMIAFLLATPYTPIEPGKMLAMAVLVAGIVQFLWMYVACQRAGFGMHLRWPSFSPEVRHLCRLMVPGVIGASVMNINIFIDTILASFLPEKAISFLFYADRLNQFPLSILGIALGTALLPALSRQLKANQYEEAERSKKAALEFAVQLTLPAAVGLGVLSYPLIDIIYGLPAADTRATAAALSAFAVGIPGYVFTKILVASFFARQDTKTPVKIGCLCIGINLILNLSLMPYLAHVGLALATSLSAWINVVLLSSYLKKRQWFSFPSTFWGLSLKVGLASGLMGISVYWMYHILNFSPFIVSKIFVLTGVILGGIGSYGIFCLLFKVITFRQLKQMLSRR